VNTKPKDIIVLGAIQAGIRKFDKIQKITQIEPEELKGSLSVDDFSDIDWAIKELNHSLEKIKNKNSSNS